jgi:hypothetical protein
MAKKSKFVPSSDKEIASVYLQKTLNELIAKLIDENDDRDDDFDIYADLKEIADKNLYDSRLDKIINRIVERIEKILVPIDKYLANKK